MRKTLLALPVVFASVAFLPTVSQAQASQCGDRDTTVQGLTDKYGENQQAIGMRSNGSLMEVYASKETGTWTILITLPEGLTCLAAVGHSYENVDEPLEEKGGQI